MSLTPETSASLLVRLRDHSDQAAWGEFVTVYQPAIRRMAIAKGLQHADAEDLTQQVLTSVARAIENWEVDPQRARFRTWLRRVANNAILNALTRAAPDRGTGDSDVAKLLGQQPARDPADSDLVEAEVRREILAWAARQIKVEFKSDTWDAFWLTTTEGLDIQEAADRLSKSVGAVYAARSRVMRRLKDKIDEFETGAN